MGNKVIVQFFFFFFQKITHTMAVFMLATLKLSRTLKLSLETTLTSSSKTENREDVKPL